MMLRKRSGHSVCKVETIGFVEVINRKQSSWVTSGMTSQFGRQECRKMGRKTMLKMECNQKKDDHALVVMMKGLDVNWSVDEVAEADVA